MLTKSSFIVWSWEKLNNIFEGINIWFENLVKYFIWGKFWVSINMLKRVLGSCVKGSNLCLRNIKNKSLLQNLPKRSAFFSFKQDEDKNKKIFDQNEDELSSLKNIAHLITQAKENNKKLPPLLPEKDIHDQDKLTVVMEMDEVLLFVFYPDEYEGYLQSPLRFISWHFQFSTRIRDYDYLLEFKKYDTFLSVYKREYLDRFLDYLKNNTEPILFTTGEKEYVDLVMVTR